MRTSSEIIDSVSTESSMAKAIKYMRKYDAEFDIEELRFEVEEVFREFYNAYLSDDIEFLEKVSADAALGMTKNLVKIRKEKGMEYTFKEIL